MKYRSSRRRKVEEFRRSLARRGMQQNDIEPTGTNAAARLETKGALMAQKENDRLDSASPTICTR